jgi:hypothetical protein
LDRFSPKQPEKWRQNKNEWLSSDEITNVLEQYEKTYPEFLYMGPSPSDFYFLENGRCVWPELCRLSLRDLIAHGKRKLGIVFNLDKHDEPGSHWVSMFVDIDNSLIFYYDSARNPTPPEITRLKNEIKKQGAALQPPIHFKYITNKHPHQRTNTECGMYSIFFIVTMLTRKIDVPIHTFKEIRRGGGSEGGSEGVSEGGSEGVSDGGSTQLSIQDSVSLFTDRHIPDAFVADKREKFFN